MKKIYNSPKINVVELRIQTALMDPSIEIKSTDANSAGMSRQERSWDED